MSARCAPILSVLAAVAMVTHAPAASACLQASRIVEPPRLAYDPFSPLPQLGALVLEVAAGDEECPIELELTDVAGVVVTRFAAGDLPLSVRAVDERVARAPNGVFSTNLTAKTTTQLRFEFAPAAAPVVPPGVVEARYALRVRARADPSPGALLPFTATVTTPSRAQLNIAGVAAAFDRTSSVPSVDFGELETGETREVFVQVRSNAPARLTISSAGKGRLTHATESGAAIEYVVDLDGESLDLADVAARDVDPSGSVAGASLRLRLTIGAADAKPSGRYEDLMTFEIAPR